MRAMGRNSTPTIATTRIQLQGGHLQYVLSLLLNAVDDPKGILTALDHTSIS